MLNVFLTDHDLPPLFDTQKFADTLTDILREEFDEDVYVVYDPALTEDEIQWEPGADDGIIQERIAEIYAFALDRPEFYR